MGPDASTVQDIEAVQYSWPEWYVKVACRGATDTVCHIWHYGPWLSEWAARALVRILRDRFAYEARTQ